MAAFLCMNCHYNANRVDLSQRNGLKMMRMNHVSVRDKNPTRLPNLQLQTTTPFGTRTFHSDHGFDNGNDSIHKSEDNASSLRGDFKPKTKEKETRRKVSGENLLVMHPFVMTILANLTRFAVIYILPRMMKEVSTAFIAHTRNSFIRSTLPLLFLSFLSAVGYTLISVSSWEKVEAFSQDEWSRIRNVLLDLNTPALIASAIAAVVMFGDDFRPLSQDEVHEDGLLAAIFVQVSGFAIGEIMCSIVKRIIDDGKSRGLLRIWRENFKWR